MEGCFSVLQCVLTAKSKMRGLSLNTGAGVSPRRRLATSPS
jgi:hypothetical protein